MLGAWAGAPARGPGPEEGSEMMAYTPVDGVFVSRPPCARCGAAARLHMLSRSGELGPCPTAWRPGTAAEAEAELRSALASGDEARVFAARGNLQRLTGRCIECGLPRAAGEACSCPPTR